MTSASSEGEPGELPDFDALRAKRNAAVQEQVRKLAEEFGVPLESMRSNFSPNACYCACPDGPCEHSWDGPEWRSEDGCAMSCTCSRCGTTAMSHSMRVGP
jgi:hypothetical protein